MSAWPQSVLRLRAILERCRSLCRGPGLPPPQVVALAAELQRQELKTLEIQRFILVAGLPYSVEDLWNVELDYDALAWCLASNIQPTPATVFLAQVVLRVERTDPDAQPTRAGAQRSDP